MEITEYKIGQPVTLGKGKMVYFIRYINFYKKTIVAAQEHLPYSHLSVFEYTKWQPSKFTNKRHKDINLVTEYDKMRFIDEYKRTTYKNWENCV